jgi:hypothetical protein
MMNRLILRLESLFIIGGSAIVYYKEGYSWLLYALLFFLPDLSMTGYILNKKYGAGFYNLFHTYTCPIILCVLSYLISESLLTSIGIVWISHIAMDRLMGYGLKYMSGFKDTHLNRI